MNPQDNTIPAEAPVKPTIEAPEAVILANINMDPNVSDAFKAAMGAAVRGAHAKAVEIEGGSISGNALGEVARQAPERSEFDTCPPVQPKAAPEGVIVADVRTDATGEENTAAIQRAINAAETIATLTAALANAREALEGIRAIYEKWSDHASCEANDEMGDIDDLAERGLGNLEQKEGSK